MRTGSKNVLSQSDRIVRCAIYTRVSTEEQTRPELNSLETQKQICEHLVAVHQLERWVVTEVFEDGGYTGSNLDRPGVQSLIAAVKRRAGTHCSVRHIPAEPFEKLLIEFVGKLGEHPSVIKATLAASANAKLQSLRPLKSKLAELEKLHRRLTGELETCVDAVKQSTKTLAGEFKVEVERIAAEKNKAELEKERVKAEVAYLENVVTDEQRIANSLRNFPNVFSGLSPIEQREFLQLVIRQITVKHGNPTDRANRDLPTSFVAKMRTRVFLVNIEFRAKSLIETLTVDDGSVRIPDKMAADSGWQSEESEASQRPKPMFRSSEATDGC